MIKSTIFTFLCVLTLVAFLKDVDFVRIENVESELTLLSYDSINAEYGSLKMAYRTEGTKSVEKGIIDGIERFKYKVGDGDILLSVYDSKGINVEAMVGFLGKESPLTGDNPKIPKKVKKLEVGKGTDIKGKTLFITSTDISFDYDEVTLRLELEGGINNKIFDIPGKLNSVRGVDFIAIVDLR